MVNDFSFEEMIPTLKQKLEDGGEVTFTVTGNSMLPLLRHKRDTVTLTAAKAPLKKYDIPFYCRADGKYILHRIIKVKDGEYIARGDNCTFIETGITDKDIIGVVTAFTRKGKQKSVKSLGYRMYSCLWANNFSYFMRKKVFLRLRAMGGKVKRKLFSLFRKG